MELQKGQQPPYRPIYSLGLVELETLKTYIETHLKIRFIQASKCLASTFSILFNKKPNSSFCLCVDYWGRNNFTIKNQYLLLLIGKSLNRLGQVQKFTQLHLTSIYHQIKIKKDNK